MAAVGTKLSVVFVGVVVLCAAAIEAAPKLAPIAQRGIVQECPNNEKFDRSITRPGCTYECYELEMGKLMLFDKLHEGVTCPKSKMNQNQVHELYDYALSNYVCRTEFNNDPNDVRLCISAQATIYVMNEVAKSCMDPGTQNMQDVLDVPENKPGVLKCGADNTFPIEQGRTENDPDLEDGALEEPPITDKENCNAKCKKRTLYDFYQTMVYITDKRYRYLKNKAEMQTRKSVQFRNEAEDTDDEEMKQELHMKADLNKEDARMNEISGRKVLQEKLLYSNKMLNLELKNPGMKWKAVEFDDDGAAEVEDDDADADDDGATGPVPPMVPGGSEVTSFAREALQTSEHAGRIGCANRGKICANHYWKKNVKVNDDCRSVCVFEICKDDFTFLYCFRITVQVGHTNPECHANVATRHMCFNKIFG